MLALDESRTKLEVSLAAGGFTGRASCFVDPDSIRAAAKRFAVFPFSVHEPAVFASGYRAGNAGAFTQVHIQISERVFSAPDMVGLSVLLAHPVDTEVEVVQAKLDCVVPTTHQRLQELATALTAMITKPDGMPHVVNLD
ncbi:hypothetical protein [Ramlibacter albus]|uniref:Uncharacterized protein n=1 Tax=Ramlibacter albus TaxID=2079448 RepID=A0A923M917_9BURK|nr:hypothetical protein [Ramlibacter albus]MBC5765116.1 hypothetical protein [Ramlibacter albus]